MTWSSISSVAFSRLPSPSSSVSIIIFLMMHAVPGGPFDGNDMPVSEAVRATLMAQLGPRSAAVCAIPQLHVGRAAARFRRALSEPGRNRRRAARRAWAAQPHSGRRWAC